MDIFKDQLLKTMAFFEDRIKESQANETFRNNQKEFVGLMADAIEKALDRFPGMNKGEVCWCLALLCNGTLEALTQAPVENSEQDRLEKSLFISSALFLASKYKMIDVLNGIEV